MTQPDRGPDARLACSQHPDVPAAFRCGFCARALCASCVEEKRLADRGVARACRSCGGPCVDLGAPASVAQVRGASLADLLRDLAAYPLRDHGLIQVGGAGVLLGLATTAGLVAALLLLAYVWAFLFQVVGTSANGMTKLPHWPDLKRGELGETLWHVVCARFLIAWPALAYDLFVLRHGHGSHAVYWLLEGLGVLLLPMTMLAVILHETPAAIDPRVILPAIWRTAGAYVPLSIVFWATNEAAGAVAGAVASWINGELDAFNPIRLLVVCAAGTLQAWALVVSCRLLGLFYRAHSARLAWF